ncbi:MAG: dihydrolipoyl dehydrogenase [Candidatus Omnitrophica bacterium]|nr:dihydrolipoyl dehydrogenase [Candidatus Omnitrophota bacterium]
MDKYDLVVLGSGPAGQAAAIRAAANGLRVAVVEKNMDSFGGVCVNEGCIPAKSLIHSSRVFSDSLREEGLFRGGLSGPSPDMEYLVKKSLSATNELKKGLEYIFKKNGIEIVTGRGRVSGPGSVTVNGPDNGEFEVEGNRLLIATGSSPRDLPGVPFDGRYVISSSEAVRMTSLPDKVLIVGSGAIGIEFASHFRSLGAEVTVLEAEDRILPFADRDISARLASVLKKKGVKIHVSSSVENVETGSGKVVATCRFKGGEESLSFDRVLVCIGRTPNTSDIGLEKAGITTDDKGYITVDDNMLADGDSVYAAGDVIPGPMLAHCASSEGEIVADHASGNPTSPIDYSCVPNVVYSHVEYAGVGLTEEECSKRGMDFRAGKSFFKANGRAVANNEKDGFIKVISDAGGNEILGAHILCSCASEIIHEFVLAKRTGLSARDIADSVHAHPTFSESSINACWTVA